MHSSNPCNHALPVYTYGDMYTRYRCIRTGTMQIIVVCVYIHHMPLLIVCPVMIDAWAA